MLRVYRREDVGMQSGVRADDEIGSHRRRDAGGSGQEALAELVRMEPSASKAILAIDEAKVRDADHSASAPERVLLSESVVHPSSAPVERRAVMLQRMRAFSRIKNTQSVPFPRDPTSKPNRGAISDLLRPRQLSCRR